MIKSFLKKRSVFTLVFLSVVGFTPVYCQNIGIGTLFPKARLHILHPGTSTGLINFPYETLVTERNADTKLGIYSTAANPTNFFGSAVTLGYTNHRNFNNFYPGYEMQYGVWTSSGYVLRFNALARNEDGTYNVNNTYSNVMVMDHLGRVGINLTNGSPVAPLPPAANLHVRGTVRFQSLPQSSGNVLVIDGSGNVGFSSAISFRSFQQMQDEIRDLKSMVSQLKQELDQVRKTQR